MKSLLTFIILVSAFLPHSIYAESNIVNPEWTFIDKFEGTKDSSFWAGSGIYLTYGAIDDTNPDNKVMAMRYVPNSEGSGDSWSEYDFHLGVNAVQVEISFKMFVPSNYKHIENNHKVYALWSGPYGKAIANISVSSEAWGGPGGATPSVYVGVDGNNYGHARLSTSPKIWSDGEGEWIQIHIFLELARNDGDFGRLEVSKNGSLITGTHHPDLTKAYSTAPDGPNIIRYSKKGNFIDQGTILGWANGDPDGGFLQETVFLIDDFTIKANSKHGEIKTSHAPKPPTIIPSE